MTVNGPEAKENAVVSYTVKDLLEKLSKEQTEGFARLSAVMDGKADKADLARIEGRLNKHDDLIDGLTQRQALDDRARVTEKQIEANRIDWRRWSVPVIISALGTAALLVSLFR